MKHLNIIILFFTLISLNLSAQDLSFMVKFKDEVNPYATLAIYLTPGEEINFETVFSSEQDVFKIVAPQGQLTEMNKDEWVWRAPNKKGIYPLDIIEITQLDTMHFNCIVMVPMTEMVNGKINNYNIGAYPASSNTHYPSPEGFVEVTKENELTRVSPHYVLKDFLCKQAGGYPKYVVLRERGILKLETVQAYLMEQGFDFDRFSFISGYRTPHYNASIGNVKYSRHVFGDAYDIYIDKDNDTRMDDLNKDGYFNKKDALYLYTIIDQFYDQPWYGPFIGGLGLYGANSRHTAFLHLDSRGFRARWGK